jgi:sigma-B regulation protein RsbU (phosphoserine phosphatase)
MHTPTTAKVCFFDLLPETRGKNFLTVGDLVGWGYQVTKFAEIEDFKPEIVQNADLLVIQWATQTKPGRALLKLLRTDVRFTDTPIFVLAESASIDEIATALAMGVEGYSAPPGDKTILQATMLAQIQKKQRLDRQRGYVVELEQIKDNFLNTILPLGIALSEEKNSDQLLERILVEAKRLCNADAGTLYLNGPGNILRFSIMRTDSLGIALGGTTGKPVPFAPLPLYDANGNPNHRNVATLAALTGKSVNIPDIYNAPGFDFSATQDFDKHNGYTSKSILTVPLKDNNNVVLGVLQLLNAENIQTSEVIPFDSYHTLVVESLSSQAAVALHNQTLISREKNLAKLENDLATAHQIQLGFLPELLPQLPGWDISARFRPARSVGGDFYDVFTLGEDKLGVVIADVCDKGVPAAMFMALIRSLIRAFSFQQYTLLPDQDLFGLPRGINSSETFRTRTLKNVVTLTNDYIIDNHIRLNMFATLFYGIVDLKIGSFTYINAGHNAPLVFGPKRPQRLLKASDPAVGMMPQIRYGARYEAMTPGDTLVMYTDGITEARNIHGELYGTERLHTLVSGFHKPPSELADRIDTDLAAFVGASDPYDDITLLILQRGAAQ